MIGSSDEEDEDDRPLAARRTPPARSIMEQRARLHHNRTGEFLVLFYYRYGVVRGISHSTSCK
jgi:hypothetical protein